MKGVIFKPWSCPPSQNSSNRVIHICNLPENVTWNVIERFFSGYQVNFAHCFGKEALIDFRDYNCARSFLKNINGSLFGPKAKIEISCIPYLNPPDTSTNKGTPSRVICLHITKLQISLSIYDIYDECSMFGTVEKIICFEKAGKYALVQMKTILEASLILSNLTFSPRHHPLFQVRVQYSKNQDIVIKFNNSKSFDFTSPDSLSQFLQLRSTSNEDVAFFTPEVSGVVSEVFNLWRPGPMEIPNGQVIKVSGFEDAKQNFDHLFRLFCQYGSVNRIHSSFKSQKCMFVQMSNSFSARIAIVFLQGCPYLYGRLNLSQILPNEPIFNENEYFQNSKDFRGQVDDPEISEYSEMWPPSKAILVTPKSSLQHFSRVCNDAIIDIERSVIMFSELDRAVSFIIEYNRTKLSNEFVSMRFTKE